jgi:flagellar biosynthesis/type III secretory pathway chaperone
MDTLRLAQLIDAKLAIAEKLFDLARQQSALVALGDLASLMRLLGGKQQLVDQLQTLDRALAPYAAEDPRDRHWASPNDRIRCQQQQLRCEAVLREILLVEQQTEAVMQQQRQAASEQLAALQHVGTAQQAYVGASVSPSATLDLTSEG